MALAWLLLLLLQVLGDAGVCFAGAGVIDEAQTTTRDAAPSYARELQPLLQAKCGRCHGEKDRKAALDLRTSAGIRRGGESGPVISPRRPDESPLYLRVQAGEMPPDPADALSAEQLDLIRRWVAAGAPFDLDDHDSPPAVPSQHDVVPILLRRCAPCHGRNRQESMLDLRSKPSMLRGGKSGPAIVPGNPDVSLLIQRVVAGEMPPHERLVEVSVKPIEPLEIETLRQWIAAGAPEVTEEVVLEPGDFPEGTDPLVPTAERDFWAFQTPCAAVVPTVSHRERARNPVDAFLLQKQEEVGLKLSPDSERSVLLRRASFDLTGLPPEPDDVESFLSDDLPDAFERLLDRLFGSPRFGERWARYWLDAAGYADSEGKREQDLPRPHAWRYRDYVIRSTNADVPFDQFLLQQIAGDELTDYEAASEITPEVYDNLVATGFLRMAPDATWANITGYLPDRIDVIADEVDILGSAVLGLSIKCARCHSHKFDPIPQRDYYRLLAVFRGAYDEYDWLKPDVRAGLGPVSQDIVGGRLLPFVTTAERRAWELRESELTRQLAEAKAAGAPADRIRDLESSRQAEPMIQALWDRGDPTTTYIYRRGDPLNPGRMVRPGVPSVLTGWTAPYEVRSPWPAARATGRRLAFARWLTDPQHPLTARVQVNQIWKHHFGSGLVRSLGNFGRAGTPPTHPELLDWLAREFIERGWNRKRIHRHMLTGSVYRQSSAVDEQLARVDPQNDRYTRMPMVRLSAEALYDTLHFVAGSLNEERFGPAVDLQAREDGLITPAEQSRARRRLIYVKQLRKKLATHLENFDYPQMNPNCLERRDSLVAPQALYLMNNGTVHELAERFADRIGQIAADDVTRQVEQVYWIAMGRPPVETERVLGREAIEQLAKSWSQSDGAGAETNDPAAHRRALASFCRAILNSAGFLYID